MLYDSGLRLTVARLVKKSRIFTLFDLPLRRGTSLRALGETGVNVARIRICVIAGYASGYVRFFSEVALSYGSLLSLLTRVSSDRLSLDVTIAS